MHESEKWKWSRSVVPYSSRPHGLQPTRLLLPWDFPGTSTGVGCHCLLCWYSRSSLFKHLPWHHLGAFYKHNISGLEKPMDSGAWWATVHGVEKSWTWLKLLSMHTYVNIILFRNKIFTAVIKMWVKRGASWRRAGPQSNRADALIKQDKRHRQTHREVTAPGRHSTRRKSTVTAEAETAVMCLQVKERRGLPASPGPGEKPGAPSALELSGRARPCLCLDLDFWSPE